MIKCSVCGIAFSGNFCPLCGTKCTPARVCRNCGELIFGRFCTRCGTEYKENVGFSDDIFSEFAVQDVPEKFDSDKVGSDTAEPGDVALPASETNWSRGLGFEEDEDGYMVSSVGTYTDAYVVVPSEHIGKPVTGIGDNAFEGNPEITGIEIPKTVTYIGNYAFCGCDSLKSVSIPDGAEYIGIYAFSDCTSLENVVVPDSVATIGANAFAGCSRLATVRIGKGVNAIDDYAFSECSSLKNMILPESVTDVGDFSFSACAHLKSMILPECLKSVGNGAFSGCGELSAVYFKGSYREWGCVEIAGDNDELMRARIFIYSEMKPSGKGLFWHYGEDGNMELW